MFIVWSRPPRLSTVNAHEPNAHGLHQRSLFDHLKTHKYTQPPSRNICFKSTFKCLCSMSNKHAHGHTWSILIDTPPDRQKERQRCTSAVRSFYSFINCSSSFLSDALIGLLIAVIAIEWHETESIVGNPSFFAALHQSSANVLHLIGPTSHLVEITGLQFHINYDSENVFVSLQKSNLHQPNKRFDSNLPTFSACNLANEILRSEIKICF